MAAGGRLWGYVINAGQGQYVLRDGGAIGTVMWDVGTAAASPLVGYAVMFPQPIRFLTDLHVTVPGGGDITLLVDPA